MIAFVAVAASVLAACGGGEETVSPSGTLGGNGAEGQAIDHDRAAPAAPIEGAVPGGTITALREFELTTMDPTEAYYTDTVSILSGLVTRSLTQYVYDPASGSMVLVPDIATDIGTPNGDFTQWSFTIRDGVKFEDGSKVTAEDVAYGIKRSFDRDTFPYGPPYSNEYFLDGDSYKGLYTGGSDYDGVVVEGDTLTIQMERPFPDMPYWGAFPAMGPIPERGSDPASYALRPLATGPYKFADYTPGESLTLVRNEEWDPDTDPGRHAYPDRYEFSFTEPSAKIGGSILGDSKAGETTLSYDNVLPGDFDRARRLDRLTLGPTQCTLMWFPDYRKIDDIRVRQAIGYAYPYQEVAKLEGNAFGVVYSTGESIWQPGFPGRQDYSVLETDAGDTDPAKARALLRAAGWAPGEYELTFLYDESDSDLVAIADQLVNALERAGFKASPYATSSQEELIAVRDDPNAPINVRSGGWCPDWQTGSSWFPQLFHSDGLANYAYFSEPAVDAEIERIGLLPIEEQPAAWGALDRSIMTDHYPVIITRYADVGMLHGARIGGMSTDNTLGMPTWKDLFVFH